MQASEYRVGDADERPWGSWEVLACGDGYIVKEITVAPGQILSLQSHDHRAEHWVVLCGIADVTLGEDVIRCKKDESAFIPIGTKHRVSNPGEQDLRFIEVQTGTLLSEEDIHRYEDQYGRR